VYEQQTGAAGGGGDWKQGAYFWVGVIVRKLTLRYKANEGPQKRQREEDDDIEPQASSTPTLS
jgi:hypothetical protein